MEKVNINTDLINQYFDSKLEWIENTPKVSIKLKDVYKGNKGTPFRPNISKKIPYSTVQHEYYKHFFGETDLAKSIYDERVKLASKHSQLYWWMNTNTLTKSETTKIQSYLDSIGKKVSDKLNRHYNSSLGDITKEKLKKRSKKWAPIIGKINSEKWNDAEWKDSEMKRRKDSAFYEKVSAKNKKRMSNAEYYAKFMKAVNSTERVNKISTASKEMWKRMKRDKPPEYYRIINSGPNKNFTINGYSMNMIEYIVATTLTSLSLEWEYEKDFDFDGMVYVPDFYISSHNLVIECYGDYWHANPNTYSSKDFIFKNMLVENIWKKDDIRKTTFIENGYSFLSFWETDIKNNINEIKNKICQIT